MDPRKEKLRLAIDDLINQDEQSAKQNLSDYVTDKVKEMVRQGSHTNQNNGVNDYEQ